MKYDYNFKSSLSFVRQCRTKLKKKINEKISANNLQFDYDAIGTQ